MGSWSVACGVSNIAITSGNNCVIIPLKENSSEYGGYVPATLPIFGVYNDYGGMEDIVRDDNVELIEKHLGITIDEFIEFLVDGKFTYQRDEVKPTIEKLEENDRFDEVENLRFMWMDRQVYDFMIINHDQHDKGNLDFGTPKMLTMFGFEKIEESDSFPVYDPKRYKQKWQCGDVFFYSDGRTLLAPNGRPIFYIGHDGWGAESTLETYFKVPEEFNYLKNLTKAEAWRLMEPRKYKSELSYIFGGRYDYDSDTTIIDMLQEMGQEITPKQLAKIEKAKRIYNKYFDDMEIFGDRIVHLINIRANMHCMSGRFYPHQLYLTPQCGEFSAHQKLLEKFAEINKTYINDEDDE